MILRSVWFLAALMLVACASGNAGRELTQTLDAYAKYIRWNEMDQALGFLDPETRAQNRDEAFELQRFEQIRITGYDVKARDLSPDEVSLTQVVELRLYNRHTLRERTVIDRQRWRYDDASERWLLVSGLPNLSRAR